tara:strand:- start:418 stop:552 length:135 start_codon:yes stop_codon:yes gene_type:complete
MNIKKRLNNNMLINEILGPKIIDIGKIENNIIGTLISRFFILFI